MRKNWLLAMAVLAPALTATEARAIPTGRNLDVSFDGQRVGRWNLRNRVEDRGESCRYTIQWSDINRAPLNRTTLCKIDEFKASDAFDCEENRRTWIDSVVNRAGTCRAFDDFGQQVTLRSLIAGESASGRTLNGIVESSSIGDVQSFTVR